MPLLGTNFEKSMPLLAEESVINEYGSQKPRFVTFLNILINDLARGALVAAAKDQSMTVTADHVRLASTEIF